MIYKNGFKEYFFMGTIFGLCMGAFFFFTRIVNLAGFFVVAVSSGTLFAFIMYLFAKRVEIKSKYLHNEIAKVRRIICEGVATIKGVGGWLFVTEDAIEFYPHKINLGGESIAVLIDDIVAVNNGFNNIEIATKESTYKFIVNKPTGWKNLIIHTIGND